MGKKRASKTRVPARDEVKVSVCGRNEIERVRSLYAHAPVVFMLGAVINTSLDANSTECIASVCDSLCVFYGSHRLLTGLAVKKMK